MEILRRQHLMYGRSRVGFRFHTSEGVYDFESASLSRMVLRPFLFNESVHVKNIDGMLVTEDEHNGLVKPIDITDNEDKLIEVLTSANLLVKVRDKYVSGYERDPSRTTYPFLYRKVSN